VRADSIEERADIHTLLLKPRIHFRGPHAIAVSVQNFHGWGSPYRLELEGSFNVGRSGLS